MTNRDCCSDGATAFVNVKFLEVKKETQKMDNIIKQRLQQVMDSAVQKGEVPGCTLLVRKAGKEEVYLESGYADVEAKIPVRRDGIYRLYSMTKPITGAAMMILVERGIVDLADSVSKYLPGFKNQIVCTKDGTTEKAWREVTVQDLLCMTSGQTYGGEDENGIKTSELIQEVVEGLDKKEGGNITTVEFANGLGKVPLHYQPGKSWSYGTSADVIGAVIETASGMRFGEFLKKEIFEPLGMKDTGFFVPSEKRKRFAKAYECHEGEAPVLYLGNNLGIQNTMEFAPAFESGGAGLVSTIDDYAKFAQMLLNKGTYEGKEILRAKTVEFFTRRVLDDAQQKGFEEWIGLEGFTYGNLMRIMKEPGRAVTLGGKGEYGWDGWLGCYFSNAPEENMTILMMTQKKDAGTFSMTRKLRNVIFSA